MSKRRDIDFLRDILNACENILEYISNMGFEEFREDSKTQDAVIWNIEIIGESVKNISDRIKHKYSEIPWKYIARTRDKIIHHYFGIDIDIIWNIAAKDIPKLKKNIERIIEDIVSRK